MDRCDVLVVGGGIAGLSIAWRLAERAVVTLVETETELAFHASGRSAAMLNVTSGPTAVCSLSAASRDFLQRPPQDLGVTTLLSPRGLLWVGRSGADSLLDALAAKAPNDSSRIEPSAVLEHAPLLVDDALAAGGVLEPGATEIDVPALIAALRAAVLARGARILPGAEAIKLRLRHGTWDVEAGAAHLAAERIVNAAGAWGDEVARRADVAPIGLEALRRTAVVLDIEESITDWPMVMDAEGRWYLTPFDGGALVSAADETPSRPTDARAHDHDVHLAVERVCDAAALHVRQVRRTWAGLRTFTADRLPAIGPDPDQPSFFWLVGQGGAGIKTAPELSRLAAASVVDGTTVPSELDIARFRHP